MNPPASTVRDLVLLLETYFPQDLPLSNAMHILSTMETMVPLMRLHNNQGRDPRQPHQTAWLKHMLTVLSRGFHGATEEQYLAAEQDDEAHEHAQRIHRDISNIFDFMGLDYTIPAVPVSTIFPPAYPLLITSRTECSRCGPQDVRRSLRFDRDKGLNTIHLLDENLVWTRAEVCVANCSTCDTLFYPDKIVYSTDHPEQPRPQHKRRQQMENDPTYICISKSGVWVHRRVAAMQESVVQCFAGGWASFADWINNVSSTRGKKKPQMTTRQSKRLFIEHFSRRLLRIHFPNTTFTCPAYPSTDILCESVRDKIGKNGGSFPSSLTHGCKDCTHEKRYRNDLVNEGAMLANGDAAEVVGIPGGAELHPDAVPAPLNMPVPQNDAVPPQQQPSDDGERGMVRMAVMDGKTIGHKICALTDCKNPLVNYKNGRFCKTHLGHADICGIIPCGQPVADGGPTCSLPAHRSWYESYAARFKRMSFAGVRRVIRRREHRAVAGGEQEGPTAPTIEVTLPPLGDTPGHQVVHTFRARSVYCVETVQWACGMPVGWGKCYKAESQTQVLEILDELWKDAPDDYPSFLAYDNACYLLRHIVNTNEASPWLNSTTFVVDAWHYTGHSANDVLCRRWCNPAPTDGSQPDLVRVEEDENGAQHLTRAFNTETAEQLNSWLTSYESQLRPMTDVSFDFFVHVLMLLFAERIERRIAEKRRDIDDDSDLDSVDEGSN